MIDVRDRSARHQRQIWRVGAIAACGSLAVCAAVGVQVWSARDAAASDLKRLHDAARTRTEAAAAIPPAESFVSTFPTTLDAEPIVQRLAAAALLNAVTLVDSRVERARSASPTELSRASLSFSLRGNYPAVKATLADTLTRTGNATLQSFSVRRDGKLDVEAQVVLSLWLQPARPAAQAN